MIEVARLSRRFGPVVAVDDLTFSLEKGEVVGFLGPNGAGKTTAMRMLTGFLPATSAERLTVAGFDVLRESMRVRERIGYLPESVPLYREMRVREMLLFQGRLHRMSRVDLRTRVPEVLERVGVRDRSRQLVGELSRGLRQRVGLAVALVHRPEVLILDEPTSGLDPLQRREVRALIRELADEHTVLLSSHILAEVENVCPRVIVLRQGKLVGDGTQAELVERYGGRGAVRFEAFVGPGVAEAIGLLQSLSGVETVHDRGKLGIHHAFEVLGEGDLREDVGALAMQQGWAVRELSWRQPTLEELFARLVLGGENLELAGAAERSGSPESPSSMGPAPAPASGASALPLAPEPGAASAEEAPARKVIYSLNPFDRGATRDLGKPMDVDGPPSDPPVGSDGGGS